MMTHGTADDPLAPPTAERLVAEFRRVGAVDPKIVQPPANNAAGAGTLRKDDVPGGISPAAAAFTAQFNESSMVENLDEIFSFLSQLLDLFFTKLSGDEELYDRKAIEYNFIGSGGEIDTSHLPQTIRHSAQVILEELEGISDHDSLVRPDLLASIETNQDHKAIFEQIVSEVQLYNRSHDAQLDPYVMANQLWQESAGFREDLEIHHEDVAGIAQIRLATAQHFLSSRPELRQELLGKDREITFDDLENKDIAIPLSVELMGYYTERWGSQTGALFAYNGGELAIARVKKHYNMDEGETPTLDQITQFYVHDRERVDARAEEGITTQAQYKNAWAVQTFEYAAMANSHLWPILEKLDPAEHAAMTKNMSEDEIRAAMKKQGIPVPESALASEPEATKTTHRVPDEARQDAPLASAAPSP